MTNPLHPATLRAITRIAQQHGLPLVRADRSSIRVGDIIIRKCLDGFWHEEPHFHSLPYRTACDALRAAL